LRRADAVTHRLASFVPRRDRREPLFPNLTGYAMKIVNRLLPDAADKAGTVRAGSEAPTTNSGMDDTPGRPRDEEEQ